MRACVIWLTFFSLPLMVISASSAQEKTIAIKAGEILTISGAPINPPDVWRIKAGIILIQNGKIVDIGTDIAVPQDASVIDASDSVVMPGLVDASATPPVRGDLNEQSSEITPALRISTALDPKSRVLKRIVQTGCTTLYVAPGGANLIAGLGVIIKPAGKTAAEMIIKDDAALKIVMGSDSTQGNRIPWYEPPANFYYRRPTTTMAVAWMLRRSFFDAKQYITSHEPAPASPDSPALRLAGKSWGGGKEDPNMEIVAAALQGKIPIRVAVRRAIDIRTALRIANEYGLSLILDECTEGYKVAEEIAKKNAPVVLGPFYYYPRTSSQYEEGREVNWNNAGILAKAGVRVAIASNAQEGPRFVGTQDESIDLLTAATFAVRHGMAPTDALKAITLTPAEILGVADRVGSLEKGKDADILILSGNPLAATSRIKRVILKGETVYQID